MNTLINRATLLTHAAEIIENQLEELHLAFILSDGSFDPQDKDIADQISDMAETAQKLKEFRSSLIY